MPTVTLTLVADAGIDSGDPTTALGSATAATLGLASPSTLRLLQSWSGISAIPAGATISAASLALAMPEAPETTGASEIKAHKLTAAFVEAQATWNSRSTGNAWTSAGGDYSLTVVSVCGSLPIVQETTNWNVKEIIVEAHASSSDTASFILKRTTESGDDDYIGFSTKEGATAPTLTVTYTAAASEEASEEARSTPSGSLMDRLRPLNIEHRWRGYGFPRR